MQIFEIKTKYVPVGTMEDFKSITSPTDIKNYLDGAFDEHHDQEQVWCILLNGNNQPIGRKLITLGLVNQSQVHPRESFRFAIREAAAGVIFAHNHPSGNVKPSQEDITTTKRMVECGKILDIPVIEHLIITDNNYFSIRANFPEIFNV